MAQNTHPAGSPIGDLLLPGYSVPDGQPDGIAADAIDPVTGEYLSISQGFDTIDSWILGQLAVQRSSGSAVLSDGRDFSDVQKNREEDLEIFRQEILRPLKPLIDGREIEARVEVEADGDTILGFLTYKIIATGQERRRLPVNAGSLVGTN